MVPNLNNLIRVKKSHIKPVTEVLARIDEENLPYYRNKEVVKDFQREQL